MKKIQVSTVHQIADVEVLFINASLIAKAIHANNTIQDIIEKAKAKGSIVPRYRPKENETGNVILDEFGQPISEPVLDEKGNHIIDYTSHHLESYELAKVNAVVATFLQELVDAFEA